MFTDRFGITTLIDGNEHLGVSWDYDTDPDDLSQRTATLFYIPDKTHHTHYHISLSDAQCADLRDWLSAYLEVKNGSL